MAGGTRFPSRFSILRHEISVLSPTTQPPNVMKKPTGGGGGIEEHLQGQKDGWRQGRGDKSKTKGNEVE